MKKLSTLILLTFITAAASAQVLNPVSWNFSSKKISNDIYEVRLTATIQKGWHLYSQSQPEDAIAVPTTFNFNKHPLLKFEGKVKEVGKLEKYKDQVLGVSAYQYSNEVVFLQRVKVKGKAKTALSGKLEFQTCNDEKCLPPKTVNFSINLI